MANLHPIVAQLKPSPEQEPAICRRGCDVVVTAGAGAGKTRTLVARYLALLAGDDAAALEPLPLRSVVAVTFTKKAAREMRNRLREEMQKYLRSSGLAAAERERWQEHYSQLDGARIGTIHGLCSDILQSHPVEAAVDPHFATLEEGQANLLRAEAVEQALAWAADDPDTLDLFALAGENGLREALDTLIRQRLDADERLPCCSAADAWARWAARLATEISGFLDDAEVQGEWAALRALCAADVLDRADANGDRLALPLRRLLALGDEIDAACAAGDAIGACARLAELRRTVDTRYGKAANWPADPRPMIRALYRAYDDGPGRWLGRDGVNLDLDRALAGAQPAWRRLFERATDLYTALKDARNALDFDDLEWGARRLLRDFPSIRAYWQSEVQALLVDEFQDTNARQRDLLLALAGERGALFVVGDAKQSIYRFRGADVMVFRQERARIGQAGGCLVDLSTSYRAHRELVQGLNDLLRPILGAAPDATRPYAEPFAPLSPYRPAAAPGFSAPHIELHLTARGDEGASQAAQCLVARIVELVEDGQMQIQEAGGLRPLHYGDIVILCRAASSFGAYEDALEAAGVPFLTVAGRGFYRRPEIRDLLNALRALADPGDDLALAGLLRSPAVGISDAGLLALSSARAGSLWPTLQAGDGLLDAADAGRARRAVEVIGDMHDLAGRVTAAELLKAFMDRTAYRAILAAAGQARSLRNVAKLLADAHASGIVSAGHFLEYVQGLRDSGTREGEARATAERVVQVMSVHQAKGLEFPVVAIGNVSHRPAGRASLLLDRDLGLLLPLRDESRRCAAGYALGKMADDHQDAAESARLLYVAATRAQEKLLLSGCLSFTNTGAVGKSGDWLTRLLAPEVLGLEGTSPAWRADGNGKVSLQQVIGATTVACTIYEPRWQRQVRASQPPASYVRPEPEGFPLLPPPPPAGGEPRQSAEVGRELPDRVWTVVPPVDRPSAPAWVTGKLVHEALALWRFPNREPAAEDGFAAWAAARGRSFGLLDPRQLADATAQARRLLLRFQAHPLYAEIERAALRLHEVPYNIPLAGGAGSGMIDLLFQGSAGWQIVEFKTDTLRNEQELGEVLRERGYADQAARYRAAVSQVTGETPLAVLCFLNYAGGVYVEAVPASPG